MVGVVTAKHLQDAIATLRYAYPLLVFTYFLVTLIVTVCMLQTQQLRVKDATVRRNVLLTMIVVVAGGYLAEALTIGVKVSITKDWYPGQDRVVYLIASMIIFGAQSLALTDSKFPVWYPYFGTWVIGAIIESILVVVPNIVRPPSSLFDFIFIFEQVWRMSSFLALLSLYFGLRNDKKQYDNADAERQSLLRKKIAPRALGSEDSVKGKGYGATTGPSPQRSETAGEASDAGSEDSYVARERKAQELIAKRLKQDGNWFTYAKGFTIFFPYVWPYHSRTLQLRAVMVGGCLLATNALNVLVPNQMGVMVDSLTHYIQDGDKSRNVWLPVLVYTILRFAIGGGCIGWLQKWLWMPLEQYSYDALSTASHAHLMSLSSDFHDSKTSSDLTQAVSGGRSVSALLETVCFRVVPMFIDLAVAFTYLWVHYGPYMGLLMAATVCSYLYITTKLVSQKANARRNYISLYRKEQTISQQSLDGWITASLFNMIPYEERRYASAVQDQLKADKSYTMSSQAVGAAQNLLLTLGLLGALWLGVWQVTQGEKTVGSFTTLIVYWAQLQGPLIFFCNMYSSISHNLMNSERLLELFQTKPTIVDLPGAKPLKLTKGVIKFDRVSFAYDDRKPTLKNVSFTVPAGKTVALVGETGGGKSTMLKMIGRFYDCKSGSITIDGQDIRDVTLTSLREKIGVVPQEPVLFNDSIMNNIRYARITATDKEVYEACRAAAVHDKIMSFPDGYSSKVGDRGVKLSGGEKQRVAIARAILKQPDIILLDEATSAVDTATEQMIQEGFKSLCKDRTTFIVAHRLSTIMNADHILVVMHGEIVESGSHHDLIHSKGQYHDLWSKQIFVTPAAERSRSRSPIKRDADIINDLTPIRQKAELAKVLRTTTHTEPGESGRNVAGEDRKGTKISGHRREGSKLKPEAPEFVPSQQPAAAVNLPEVSTKDAVKTQRKQEKEERKAASLGRKNGKKSAKSVEYSTADESAAGQFTDQLTEGEVSGADPPKVKRGRPSRRHLAKSEPSSRAQASHDGAQDSDVTAVSSGEGQPIIEDPAVRRRVSAPSDPSVGSLDSRGPRFKRARHWRLKNRAADNPESGTESTATTSGEGSTDSHSAPAPVPSPAEGLPTTTIRFAPGC